MRLKIGFLCGLLLVFRSFPALAGNAADSLARQLRLDEVEVVAERTSTPATSYLYECAITRKEIAALPVQNVADILKYIPGVDVRARGASGAQADISVRGGTFDQVVILLNGVNLTDAQTGHYSLNMPLSVDLIDRIEISKTGVINIITARAYEANRWSAKGRLTTGMNTLVNPALTYSWHKDAFYLNTSAEYCRSDGYYAPTPSPKEQVALNNSDLRLVNIYLQTDYKGLELQAAAQYKDAGAGMFYGFGSQDQFDATRTAFGSARYKHAWGAWGLEANASYRANYDRYEWHRGQRLYGNFHFAQNATAMVKGTYTSRFGTTTLGVELRNENIHSTNIGDTVNPDGQVPNVAGFPLSDVRVLDLVKGKNRLNINYFAEQSFAWKQLTADLFLTGSWNTMFGHHAAGNARIAYRYAALSSVYLTASRTLRLPTFTDLYYNAGNQLGNRELRPEKAWTLALGTDYRKLFSDASRLSVHAEGFYRWGRDIIDWVYVPDDLKRPFHAQNLPHVNGAGAEAAIGYGRDKWLRKAEISYAYTWLDLDVDKSGSRYLDYLSHKLVFRLEHDIWRFRQATLGAAWTLTWQKREGQYNTAEGSVADYQPVLLLDGQLFWEYAGVKVAVDCTNMTNRHYYDYGGILQPGAWAKLTLSFCLAN